MLTNDTLARFESLMSRLSPEMLHATARRAGKTAEAVKAGIMAEWATLEETVGQKVNRWELVGMLRTAGML